MRVRAMGLAVILSLVSAACGGKTAEDHAREACEPLNEEEVRTEAGRLEYLRDQEAAADLAANSDERWVSLWEARRELRRATEVGESRRALAAGLAVVQECEQVPGA